MPSRDNQLQVGSNIVRILLLIFLVTMSLPRTQLFAQQDAGGGVDPHATEERAAERQALGFLGYLDHQRFADSYAYTGMLIRTQVDRSSFSAQVEKARAGTGALLTRELMDATYATSVPGAPEGQYVVLHYHSSFADKQEAVETLTLAFAKGYWRVSGYYIK
jgi:Protein of unknown function (DUF4019)